MPAACFVDLIQDDSDRQLVLLAIGHLAAERPGFDYCLGLIADKLSGRKMFEEFRNQKSQLIKEATRAGTPPEGTRDQRR